MRAREAELAAKITALPDKKYGVIYADPPVAVRAVFARHRHGSSRRQPLSDDARPMRLRRCPCLRARGRSPRAFLWATAPMIRGRAARPCGRGASSTSRKLYGTRRSPEPATGFEISMSFCWSPRAARRQHPPEGTQWPSRDPVRSPRAEKAGKRARTDRAYFPTLPKIELMAAGKLGAGGKRGVTKSCRRCRLLRRLTPSSAMSRMNSSRVRGRGLDRNRRPLPARTTATMPS